MTSIQRSPPFWSGRFMFPNSSAGAIVPVAAATVAPPLASDSERQATIRELMPYFLGYGKVELRWASGTLEKYQDAMGWVIRPTTKSASPSSLRLVMYSLTQLSARGLKNSTRSLLPLPMIVASPVSKLMDVRFSDNASDIRAPVPRSTSTSTRNPSQSTSYERGPFRRGIAATYCWISSGVKNWTSRFG